jgi:hypothetical protein
MKLNSVFLTMVLSVAFTPLALAQSQAPGSAPPAPAAAPTSPGGAAPPATKLSEPEVIHALEVRGYTEVHTVQRNGNILQLQAKKNGKPVKLVVDTVTRRAAVQPQ